MNLSEITTAIDSLDNWSLDGNSISKNFEFKNFVESLEFINKVGEIAESQVHHPDILINYNKVRLSLTTHSSNSLTQKDFEVAKAIDKL